MSNVSFKVQIVYKSGYVFTSWFDEFKIKHDNGVITSVSWTLTDTRQHWLYPGVANIESIVQLDHVDTSDTPNKTEQ